jgi:hypothetical protein
MARQENALRADANPRPSTATPCGRRTTRQPARRRDSVEESLARARAYARQTRTGRAFDVA